MITKEQALTCTRFIQTHGYRPRKAGTFPFYWADNDLPIELIGPKSINWRANGKCQVWKTRLDEFKLPIKHGLRDYGYLTHENAHLFEVAK